MDAARISPLLRRFKSEPDRTERQTQDETDENKNESRFYVLNFPFLNYSTPHMRTLCSRLVDIRVMMLGMLRFSHQRKQIKNHVQRCLSRIEPRHSQSLAIIHGQHSCTVKVTLLKTLAQLRTHTQMIRWMPRDDLRHLQTAQNTPQRRRI